MMTFSGETMESLHDFFEQCATTEELRTFVRRTLPELENTIHWNTDHSSVAMEFVGVLARRGHLTAPFFEHLIRWRPGKRERVLALAEALGYPAASFPPEQAQGTATGRVRSARRPVLLGAAVLVVAVAGLAAYGMFTGSSSPPSDVGDDTLAFLRRHYHESSAIALPLVEGSARRGTCVDSAVVVTGAAPHLDFVSCKAGGPPEAIHSYPLPGGLTPENFVFDLYREGSTPLGVVWWNHCVEDYDQDETLDQSTTRGIFVADATGRRGSLICDCFDDFVLGRHWNACSRTSADAEVNEFLDSRPLLEREGEFLNVIYKRWTDANRESPAFTVEPVEVNLVDLADTAKRPLVSVPDPDSLLAELAGPAPPKGPTRFHMIEDTYSYVIVEVGCPLEPVALSEATACKAKDSEACACLRTSRVWYASRHETPMPRAGIVAESGDLVAFTDYDDGVGVLHDRRLERYRVARGIGVDNDEYDGPQVSALRVEGDDVVVCGYQAETLDDRLDLAKETRGDPEEIAAAIAHKTLCRVQCGLFAPETMDCRKLDRTEAAEGPLYSAPTVLFRAGERRIMSARNGCLYFNSLQAETTDKADGRFAATMLLPLTGERCPAGAVANGETITVTPPRGEPIDLQEACRTSYRCIPFVASWRYDGEVISGNYATRAATDDAVVGSFRLDTDNDRFALENYVLVQSADWLPAHVAATFYRDEPALCERMAAALAGQRPSPGGAVFLSTVFDHEGSGFAIDDRGQVLVTRDGQRFSVRELLALSPEQKKRPPVRAAPQGKTTHDIPASSRSAFRFRLCDHC